METLTRTDGLFFRWPAASVFQAVRFNGNPLTERIDGTDFHYTLPVGLIIDGLDSAGDVVVRFEVVSEVEVQAGVGNPFSNNDFRELFDHRLYDSDLTAAVADGVTDQAATVNAIHDALATKLDKPTGDPAADALVQVSTAGAVSYATNYVTTTQIPTMGTVPGSWDDIGGGDGELIYGRHSLTQYTGISATGITFASNTLLMSFYNDLPTNGTVALVEFNFDGTDFSINQGNFVTPTGTDVTLTFVADGAPDGWPTTGSGTVETKLSFNRVEGGTGISTDVTGDTLTINTSVPALPARNGNTQYLSVTLPPAGGGVATWGQTVQTIPSGNGEYNLTIANGLPSWTIDSNTPTAGGLGVSYTLSDDVTTRTVGTSAVIEFSSEREAIRFFRLLPTVAGGQEITLDGTAYTLVYDRTQIRRTDNLISFGVSNVLQIAGVDQPWPTNTATVTLTAVVAETGVPTINEEDGNVNLSWDAVTNTFSANVDISSRYAPGDPVILQTLFPNESTNTPIPSQLAQTDAVVREQLGVVGFELLAPFTYNPGADQNAVQTFTFAATNVDAAEYIGDLQAKAAHYAVFNSGEQVALLYTQSPPMIGEDLVYNVLGWFDRNVAIRLTPFISIPEIENGRIWVLDDTDTFVSNDRLEEVRHEIPTDVVTHTVAEGVPFIPQSVATIPQHLNTRSTIRFTITSGDGHVSHHDSILDLPRGSVNVNGEFDTSTAWQGARYTCYFPDTFAFGNSGSDYYTTPEIITTATATPLEDSTGTDGDFYFQTGTAMTVGPPPVERTNGIYQRVAGVWTRVPNNTLGRVHLREVRERSIGDGTGNSLREVVFELLNPQALLDILELTAANTALALPAHLRQGDRIGVYVAGSEDDVAISNVILTVPTGVPEAMNSGVIRFRHESEAIDFFREAIGPTNSFRLGGLTYSASTAIRDVQNVIIQNSDLLTTPVFRTSDSSINNEIFRSMAGVDIDATPSSEVILRFENNQVNEFFQRDRDLFLDHLPSSGPVVMEVNDHYYWFDNAAAFQHSETNNLNDVFYNLGRGGFYTSLPNARSGSHELRTLNSYTTNVSFTAPVNQGAYFRRLAPNQEQVLVLGNLDVTIDYANSQVSFPSPNAGQTGFTVGMGTPSGSTISVGGTGAVTTANPNGYLGSSAGLNLTAGDIQLGEAYVTGELPGARITSNSITATQIAGDTITAAEIAENAVGNSELAANAVLAENIMNGEVGSDELGTDAVTTVKILNNAVTDAKGGRLSTTKELNGNSFKVEVMGTQTAQSITFDVYDALSTTSITEGDLYIVRVYNAARAQTYQGLRFYTTSSVDNFTGTFSITDSNTLIINLNAQESPADPVITVNDLTVGSTVTFEKFDTNGLLSGGFLLPEGAPFGQRSTYIDTTGRFFITNPTAAGTLAAPKGVNYYQEGDSWYLIGQGGSEIVSF